MRWTPTELELLSPVIDLIEEQVVATRPRSVLVVRSAGGEMAERLARQVHLARPDEGRVVGIERSPSLLRWARANARAHNLDSLIEFLPAEPDRIALPDASFELVVSDAVVFRTPRPTQFQDREIFRVLRPRGRMVLTNVIANTPLARTTLARYRTIGLDHVCDAGREALRESCEKSGFVDVRVSNITGLVRPAWEERRRRDRSGNRVGHYDLFLGDGPASLGPGVMYVMIVATRPGARRARVAGKAVQR